MPGPVLVAPRVLGPRALVAILGLALLVRLVAVAVAWDEPLDGDALFYSAQAGTLADGDGFRDPFADLRRDAPAAAAPHPPLFPVYLAAWTAVGVDTERGHRAATALLGLLTVLLVAELGARLAGRRGAVVAGVLAAVWPTLWYVDAHVQAEAIAAPAVAAFSVAGLAFLRRPTVGRLAAVGALAGLAALGRAELVLLVAVVPLLAAAPAHLGRSARVGLAAAGLAAAVAVVAPWSGYNLARFDEPVTLSTGAGLVLVSSNCDATYYGGTIGYWQFPCSVQGANASGALQSDDASVRDARMRTVAVDYATEHRGRWPAVVAARGARFVGVWPPGDAARLARAYESMPTGVYLAAQVCWLAALALAVVAIRRARALGHRLSPLVAPPVIGLVTALAVYGIVRFRAPIEPPLVALAAAGAVVLWERRTGRQEAASPSPATRIVRRSHQPA